MLMLLCCPGLVCTRGGALLRATAAQLQLGPWNPQQGENTKLDGAEGQRILFEICSRPESPQNGMLDAGLVDSLQLGEARRAPLQRCSLHHLILAKAGTMLASQPGLPLPQQVAQPPAASMT